MTSVKTLLLTIALAFTGTLSKAYNPYLPLWEFIPDGEPYVFEDPDNPGKYRVYIYGSHDMLEKYYCGKDLVTWSASVDNLNEWRYDGVIFESKTDANGKPLFPDGERDVLYAPDVVETRDADGKKVYYLYPNVQSDERGNLVAKSSRPDGPFTPCNWSKDDPRRTVGPFRFDPAAFVDDDGRAYGYWGFERSYAAELDPATMATVKPGTSIVEDMIPDRKQDKTFRFFEASSIRKIKDKYVFIYSRWTNEGESGLPQTNYTLAYCYSNKPLGPWTYGGTIIDGRGRETRRDGTVVPTAAPYGNTHGSICQINGKWWVFYHRQADTTEYSRQAMVAPVTVEVQEGPDGYVRISEAEYTCEGFETEGLDPLQQYPAGIACYYTGPTPARQQYPSILYTGSHTKIYRGQYDVKSGAAPYDRRFNRCSMVNNTSGSVIGYKYFNFSKTYGKEGLKMRLSYMPEGTGGIIDIFLDRPSEEEGGVRLTSYSVPAERATSCRTVAIPVEKLKHYNGKHALFLTFTSSITKRSICQIDEIGFQE